MAGKRKAKTERLRKGNEWLLCVACGHREQRPQEDLATDQPLLCPVCQQVLSVETKATKEWTG